MSYRYIIIWAIVMAGVATQKKQSRLIAWAAPHFCYLIIR